MASSLASALRALVVALSAAPLAAGCFAAAGGSPEDVDTASSGRVQALSAADAVARAREWVAVAMPYCGGVNGGSDVLCGGTCRRSGAAASPEWDAYRSDCSGLVSYAWGLPAPGRVTSTLPGVSQEVAGQDLAPGDALNNDHHVVLFAGWVNRGAGTASIIHEPDCGRVATELTVTLGGVGAGSALTLWGEGYTALRYVNMEGADPGGGAGDACGGLTYQGACEGNVLKWCENGALRSYDCGANGKACGWESDAVGNNCVQGDVALPQDTPQNNCNGIDYLGVCDGETLVWCQEGELRTYDCAAASLSCKWQSDTEGNNCL